MCETDFKGQDILTRAVAGLCVVVGLFGIGGYLKGASATTEPRAAVDAKRFADVAPPVTARVAVPKTEPTTAQTAQVPARENVQTVPKATELTTFVKPPPADPVYMCGAETKKGTPCSRRVKGNSRCFQHTGMPAMLTPDKLKVN